eukprot:TRINITY_DN67851_c5_g1_i2.p1 TRINITY_DN67851_c5_g1~~TRINITY_DN67851_c5_g1_i2.p1  ORF type:complete len:388 (+),score=37.21 TRINITY_DN67851_c5_g1_i2:39-1166(+)
MQEEAKRIVAARDEASGAPARKIQKTNRLDSAFEGLFFYSPGDTCATYYRQAPNKKYLQILVMDQFLRSFQETALIIGTDYYTPESDVVAATLHSNRYKIDALPDKLVGAVIGIQIHTGQRQYISAYRNGIRSASWQGTTEFCFQPLMFKCVWDMKQVREFPVPRHFVLKKHKPKKERVITANVQFAFDLANNLRLAYARQHMLDAGFEEKDWASTSYLHKAAYFTSGRNSYELSLENWHPVQAQWLHRADASQAKGASSSSSSSNNSTENDGSVENRVTPLWRWAKVKKAVIEYQLHEAADPSYQPLPTPLPDHLVTVVHAGLQWNELVWTTCGVEIRGETFYLSTVHLQRRSDQSEQSSEAAGSPPAVKTEAE